MALLEVNDLVSGYGSLEVLHGISLDVAEGEIVSVLGANGAGKTTFLRAVSGVLDTWSGTVRLDGGDLAGMSVERRAGAGLGHLPEGRGIFQNLTVRENLDLGTVLRRDGATAVNADRERLLGIFPDLAEKIRDGASSLSGGQQQMLALARAMLTRPKLLMIDELSFGLAPFLVVRAAGDLQLVFLWLGIFFACVLIPSSLVLSDPPEPLTAGPPRSARSGPRKAERAGPYLRTTQFGIMWTVFFANIAAGISVISFQSELLQEVWGLADPSIDPAKLAEYGATLIAVSSLCNGVGRLFWGLLSDRFGRVSVFRMLLASQMVVFGILMTETNPWIFSALVCYVLLCFGGGFATMPSFIIDVFGSKNMSKIYGTVLTARSAAGIVRAAWS